MPFVYCSVSVLLFASYWLLLVACCLLFVACYSSIVHCLLVRLFADCCCSLFVFVVCSLCLIDCG